MGRKEQQLVLLEETFLLAVNGGAMGSSEGNGDSEQLSTDTWGNCWPQTDDKSKGFRHASGCSESPGSRRQRQPPGSHTCLEPHLRHGTLYPDSLTCFEQCGRGGTLS